MNNINKDSPVRILVKDINNIDIIYEIRAKMSDVKKLEGIGMVTDYRTGEILMVNFDNNNIISNNFFNEIPSYMDKEEFNMYRKNIKGNNNISDPAQEINTNDNITKNEIIDKYI